jgi:hypothetical protein
VRCSGSGKRARGSKGTVRYINPSFHTTKLTLMNTRDTRKNMQFNPERINKAFVRDHRANASVPRPVIFNSLANTPCYCAFFTGLRCLVGLTFDAYTTSIQQIQPCAVVKAAKVTHIYNLSIGDTGRLLSDYLYLQRSMMWFLQIAQLSTTMSK